MHLVGFTKEIYYDVRSYKRHISRNIFAADQRLFDVSYPVSIPSPAPQVSSPTTPSAAVGSGDVILSDLMCP